jgi:hypothetical protein
MNRKVFLVAFIIIIFISFGIYKLVISKTAAVAGLKIATLPVSSVYINDKLIGKTPFETRYPAGEYVLKLIPDDSSYQASFWQGKVVLNPSVWTYIKKELGTSELKTAGEILTLEKISQSDAQLNVVSQTEGATVILDGQEKGITPLFINDIIPGEHDVAVTSTGFIQRTVRVQATTGYKLNINFQLALSTDDVVVATPSVSLIPSPTTVSSDETAGSKQSITIKDTPTGFLRVRSGPNLSATETAQIKPGEKFPLIEEREGWFKITLSNGKEGWVSSRYADKNK